MIKKILFFFSLIIMSCSSDSIVRSQKTSFYNIYKNIIIKEPTVTLSKERNKKKIYDRVWLSKFKQPIILLSSLDEKNNASLVALGNNENDLTWVSSDGISVSFSNGILIATRGFSQDLMETKYDNLKNFFTKNTKNHFKTLRYLDGQNDYTEINFLCSFSTDMNTASSFLDLTITTTKFTEICKAEKTHHTNEYYVLPNTNIVLKSKQWISETNGSMIIYNYYAFQNNLL